MKLGIDRRSGVRWSARLKRRATWHNNGNRDTVGMFDGIGKRPASTSCGGTAATDPLNNEIVAQIAQ